MLGEHLNKFIIAYLDNIIIYFNSKEEYYKDQQLKNASSY